MSSTLKWPLVVGSAGMEKVVDQPDTIIRDRLLALLSTRIGDRVMLPGYGFRLASEMLGTQSSMGIDAAVREAVQAWLPSVTITDVRSSRDGGPSGSSLGIDVRYLGPSGAGSNLSMTMEV